MVKKVARKFAKVPKTKGVPKVYLQGAKNKKKSLAELKSTAKKYKEGKLTKADMNRIARKRSQSATKNYKKRFKG